MQGHCALPATQGTIGVRLGPSLLLLTRILGALGSSRLPICNLGLRRMRVDIWVLAVLLVVLLERGHSSRSLRP